VTLRFRLTLKMSGARAHVVGQRADPERGRDAATGDPENASSSFFDSFLERVQPRKGPDKSVHGRRAGFTRAALTGC
jgi:hypothetical protein